MEKILVLDCDCGEEVYEDDVIESGHPDFVYCINCFKSWHKDKLEERKIVKITHPPTPN